MTAKTLTTWFGDTIKNDKLEAFVGSASDFKETLFRKDPVQKQTALAHYKSQEASWCNPFWWHWKTSGCRKMLESRVYYLGQGCFLPMSNITFGLVEQTLCEGPLTPVSIDLEAQEALTPSQFVLKPRALT